jgi:hypothetical protein
MSTFWMKVFDAMLVAGAVAVALALADSRRRGRGSVRNPDLIPPPDGYPSWLDFAVETFDTRGLWVERLTADDRDDDRDAMREAARAALRLLRAAARERPET